ncbi:hypothetical protein AW736_02410 [Termitidicoccus mucosus]|uniref:Uncharacterized protein n=2 Tax=Termitidicoccus mucosus TaxID=1184151 RepID=A0A178INZ9_9BACT|nr:hypothetical protein AW736_02410 [Opitutaceae bacterium TSB47]
MPEGAGQEVLASWVVKPLADYTLDIVVPLGGISYKAKTGAYILAPVIERGGMTVRQGSLEWMREAAKRQRALVGELRHMLGRVRGAVPSSGADGTREADVHAR